MPPGDRVVLGPYLVAVPAGWTQVAPKSDMRAAQFAIGSDAELVVYYFGSDGAGSVEDNIDRWLLQFTQADGKPSKDVAKVEHTKLLGHDATIVSVSGRFTAMAMPGSPDPVVNDDQAMLAAITGSSAGPYYWKLVGARPTVEANAAKFRAMLTSLKLK